MLAFFVNGIFQVWCGLILRSAIGHKRFASAVSVVGVAFILVGASYLPFYLGGTSAAVVGGALAVHVVGTLTISILAPIIAISTYRFTRGPLRYFSPVLGVFALVAFFRVLTGIYLGMGSGGMERMIFYPFILW